jgi:hypothetical protein
LLRLSSIASLILSCLDRDLALIFVWIRSDAVRAATVCSVVAVGGHRI